MLQGTTDTECAIATRRAPMAPVVWPAVTSRYHEARAELHAASQRRLAACERPRPPFDPDSPRRVRERGLVTMVDVALTIGVDPRDVARWERGDTDGADPEMLFRWAEVLTILIGTAQDHDDAQTRNVPDLVIGDVDDGSGEEVRRSA